MKKLPKKVKQELINYYSAEIADWTTDALDIGFSYNKKIIKEIKPLIYDLIYCIEQELDEDG